MKNLKTTTFILLAILLIQSCASVEITQSRYGNGLGISMGFESKKEKEAAKLMEERRTDIISQHQLQRATKNMKSRLPQVPLVSNTINFDEEFELESTENIANLAPAKNENAAPKAVSQSLNTGETNFFKTEKTYQAAQLDIPADVEKTQGDTTKLGYLGGLLIIVGLILIILTYGAGVSIVALGVVLIILAYFLG